MVKSHLLSNTVLATDFRDAFKEEKGAGMKIYRLVERLHHFFGSGIWWSSLKQHVETAKAVSPRAPNTCCAALCCCCDTLTL